MVTCCFLFTGVQMFEGREGFYKLGHKFLAVLREKVTCKHYSALLSKFILNSHLSILGIRLSILGNRS